MWNIINFCVKLQKSGTSWYLGHIWMQLIKNVTYIQNCNKNLQIVTMVCKNILHD